MADPCYSLDCPQPGRVIAELGRFEPDGTVTFRDREAELLEVTLCVDHARLWCVDGDDPTSDHNVVLDPRKLHGWEYVIGFDADGQMHLTIVQQPPRPGRGQRS